VPDPAQIGALVDRYGLPLVLVVGTLFAVWRNWIVIRSGSQDRGERLFLELLRQEERAGRLKAEERLAKVVDTVAPALGEFKTLLGELEKEVIRGRRSNGS
jgi:hypothetical protein